MTRSHRWRTAAFGLVAVIVLLLLTEIILRLVISASVQRAQDTDDATYEYKLWQVHLFDSFMGMHQSDPELFWKMKADFRSSLLETNSMGFIGPEIGEKASGVFRILFLGDSTPLGIGLPDFRQSFVFQLEELLESSFPGRDFEVINAATAGYSSWQCRRLLELRGPDLRPDLVITYVGNNDPSINGFLSDRQLYDLTSSYGSVKRLLGASYIYQVIKALWLGLRAANSEDQDLRERVSVEEFGENLKSMALWCSQHECRLGLCTVPTPDLWPPGIQFKVFSDGRDAEGRLVMADRMRADIGGRWSLCLDTLLLPGHHDFWTRKVYASAFSDTGDARVAETFYRRQIQTDPDNAQYLNNLGVLLWNQGRDSLALFEAALELDSLNPVINYNLGIAVLHQQPDRAHLWLERARENDRYSLRIKSRYNQAIREVASQMQTIMVDLEPAFVGLPESDYFVDHCHPTLMGHRMIAERLRESIQWTLLN